MCKTLAEGGPCYSHKKKAVQAVQEKYMEGLDKFARESGTPIDEKALLRDKQDIVSDIKRSKERMENGLQFDLEKAEQISERGRKNKLFYSTTRQQLAIESKSKELGIDQNVMAQALPIFAELESQEKRLEKLNTKVYGIDMDYEGRDKALNRHNQLIDQLDAVYEKNQVSESDQDKIHNMKSVGKLLAKSFTHHNALNDFQAVKEKLHTSNQEIINLKQEQEQRLAAVEAKPPLDREALKNHVEAYSKLPEAKKLQERMNQANKELEFTDGYIENFREKVRVSGYYDAPEKTQQMKEELNHLITQRALTLGKARGFNSEESIRNYYDRHFTPDDREELIAQLNSMKKS